MMAQQPGQPTESETVTGFWRVNQHFDFDNVGVARAVGTLKVRLSLFLAISRVISIYLVQTVIAGLLAIQTQLLQNKDILWPPLVSSTMNESR